MGTNDTPDESGFVIDKVGEGTWSWALLDHNGTVLARSGRGYETRQDAQVAIASTRIAARESDVPVREASDDLIGNHTQ